MEKGKNKKRICDCGEDATRHGYVCPTSAKVTKTIRSSKWRDGEMINCNLI